MVKRYAAPASIALLALFPVTVLPALGASSAQPARPRVSPNLGAVPGNCPAGANPHNVNPAGGSWIGSGPVQAVGLWRGPQDVLPVGGRQRYGYPQKVLWLVGRKLHQDVTVRGWNLRTGQRVWFGFTDQGPYRSTPVPVGILYYRYPTAMSTDPVFARRWFGYSSLIFVPAAGCYVLYAQWRTGGWIVPFAAGA
jgi:hypothetical protein